MDCQLPTLRLFTLKDAIDGKSNSFYWLLQHNHLFIRLAEEDKIETAEKLN